MSSQFNEVMIHLDESLDDEAMLALEDGIRHDKGVVSVGHRNHQNHLMVVVYDTEVMHGANLLHHFQERGLHAQLVGM